MFEVEGGVGRVKLYMVLVSGGAAAADVHFESSGAFYGIAGGTSCRMVSRVFRQRMELLAVLLRDLRENTLEKDFPETQTMSFTYYLSSLGLIPFFTSRMFVPMFTTASLARIGPEVPFFAGFAGIEVLSHLPAWATSNVALLILGAFAGIEVTGTKVPEVRELLPAGAVARSSDVAPYVPDELLRLPDGPQATESQNLRW